MEPPWQVPESNSGSRVKPDVATLKFAKRVSGAMSHHTVSQPSANGSEVQQLPQPPLCPIMNRVPVPVSYNNEISRPQELPLRRSPSSKIQIPITIIISRAVRKFRTINSTLRASLSLVILLLVWASLLGTVNAQHANVIGKRSALPKAAVPVEDLIPKTWEGPSLLLLDTRPPPEIPLMPLYRRQNDNDETTSSTKTASTPTSKSASLKTEPTASSSPFVVPKPFDTALSNNFTAGCATFFRRLLGDETFQQCHPFSLLLQTSSGFFDASKSYIRITQTLEATCRANETICTDTMNGLARELVQDSNCATDYSNDNPQVLQAYNGLIAYEPLYQASCLRDSEGSYCYANAVTNTSATTDSYPYYLPLGVDLPGGARPTCNSCLQNAMAIFSAFAGNTSQPISKTYNAGAQQIQVACGPQFVNKTATPQKGAASPALATASFAPTITLIAMIFVFLFQ